MLKFLDHWEESPVNLGIGDVQRTVDENRQWLIIGPYWKQNVIFEKVRKKWPTDFVQDLVCFLKDRTTGQDLLGVQPAAYVHRADESEAPINYHKRCENEQECPAQDYATVSIKSLGEQHFDLDLMKQVSHYGQFGPIPSGNSATVEFCLTRNWP